MPSTHRRDDGVELFSCCDRNGQVVMQGRQPIDGVKNKEFFPQKKEKKLLPLRA